VSHTKKSQKIGRRRFGTILTSVSSVKSIELAKSSTTRSMGYSEVPALYVLSTINRPMFPDIPSQRGTHFSSAMRIDLLTNHPQFHIFGPYCALFYPILPFWLVVAISPSKFIRSPQKRARVKGKCVYEKVFIFLHGVTSNLGFLVWGRGKMFWLQPINAKTPNVASAPCE
jgi:hypothetical protein